MWHCVWRARIPKEGALCLLHHILTMPKLADDHDYAPHTLPAHLLVKPCGSFLTSFCMPNDKLSEGPAKNKKILPRRSFPSPPLPPHLNLMIGIVHNSRNQRFEIPAVWALGPPDMCEYGKHRHLTRQILGTRKHEISRDNTASVKSPRDNTGDLRTWLFNIQQCKPAKRTKISL